MSDSYRVLEGPNHVYAATESQRATDLTYVNTTSCKIEDDGPRCCYAVVIRFGRVESNRMIPINDMLRTILEQAHS